jgi:type IV pilus assembly protein PilM
MPGFRNNEVIGVDIGSSSVKMVQLRRNNGSWALTAAGVVEIAQGPGSGGAGEGQIVAALKECLRSTGVGTRTAVCGVSGPEVAVRPFTFPALPLEEMEGAIRLEASQLCPFNIDDCAVSYQVISEGEQGVSGILVAATNKVIGRKKRCAEGASLQPVLMDVDGLALLNCFNEVERPAADRTIAVLNVGGSWANLGIMGRESPPFVRDIACPGDEIAELVGGEQEFSAGAGTQTLPVGASDDRPRRKPNGTVEGGLDKLAEDINETLRYYTARERSAFVEKLFVCGGPAGVEGFVEWLGRQLGLDAVLWNPLKKITCEGSRDCGELVTEKGPAMAVAGGLAMRSF